ncbi:MAG TPA: alkaline phosphatase, partial [Armatimonadota bacterium]|nr:alkaline phosphatase [Armatimonadota bacterium]
GAGNPDAVKDATKAYQYISKEDWDTIKSGKSAYTLVQSREEFQKLATTPSTTPVLGAFRNQSNLAYCKADRQSADPALPTLAEMAGGTLNCLDGNNGFFLMIEGGAIDWCGHANDLNGAIGETLAFDDTVSTVLDWIAKHGGWDQNLLIITADHDTGYLNHVAPTAAGQLPTATWGITGTWPNHTNRPVHVYYQGSGSEQLNPYTLTVNDFERGKIQVVDNTAIAKMMFAALAAKQPVTAGAR